MQYRTFGRTGWPVSEIAFGGWQIGGDWGTVDDEASIRTLHHSFARGINFVDTAELYGAGHSEEVIGRALQQWSGDRIYVATKVQPVVWPSPDDDHPQMRGRYPGWYLREGVEAALRRLQTERIDLLQLHGWMPSGIAELDWLETLNELRVEGKVDHVGVSIRDYRPDEGVDLATLGLVDSLQVVFNLFEQRPAGRLFPAGVATDTAFIARVPFDSGSLIGHWTAETYDRWEVGSVPHTLFRGDRFAETLHRVQELKRICAPYYPTLAEAAMRYSLSRPEVKTVIPGMSNPAEVDLNVVYSDGAEFPAELAAQLGPPQLAQELLQMSTTEVQAELLLPYEIEAALAARRSSTCPWAASSTTAVTCRSGSTGSMRTGSAPASRSVRGGSCCRPSTTGPAAATPPTHGRSWPPRRRRWPSCWRRPCAGWRSSAWPSRCCSPGTSLTSSSP